MAQLQTFHLFPPGNGPGDMKVGRVYTPATLVVPPMGYLDFLARWKDPISNDKAIIKRLALLRRAIRRELDDRRASWPDPTKSEAIRIGLDYEWYKTTATSEGLRLFALSAFEGWYSYSPLPTWRVHQLVWALTNPESPLKPLPGSRRIAHELPRERTSAGWPAPPRYTSQPLIGVAMDIRVNYLIALFSDIIMRKEQYAKAQEVIYQENLRSALQIIPIAHLQKNTTNPFSRLSREIIEKILENIRNFLN